MAKLILLVAALLPFAAHAQQTAATPQDEVAACNNTGAELLGLVGRLRAQIAADQREIEKLKASATPAAPAK